MDGTYDDHVVGHAAISPEAAGSVLRGVLAVVLHAYPAVCADTAAPRAIDDNWIADRKPGRAGSQFLDPARVLVSEGKGKQSMCWWRGPLRHGGRSGELQRPQLLSSTCPGPGSRHFHFTETRPAFRIRRTGMPS